MKTILKFINSEMKKAGIDYHFQVNRSRKTAYPYFVGELIPVTSLEEDGIKEFAPVLEGLPRQTVSGKGRLLELIEEGEKIEEHFPQVGGLTALLGNQAIAVFFNSVQPVDSGEEQLKKIQVNLDVKSWKGRC